MIYVGDNRGFGLNIVRIGVWVRWGGASVAWWLKSRGHEISEGQFSGEFSLGRLGSRGFFPYGIYIDRVV